MWPETVNAHGCFIVVFKLYFLCQATLTLEVDILVNFAYTSDFDVYREFIRVRDF